LKSEILLIDSYDLDVCLCQIDIQYKLEDLYTVVEQYRHFCSHFDMFTLILTTDFAGNK